MKTDIIKGSLRTNFGKMNHAFEGHIFEKFCFAVQNAKLSSVVIREQEKSIKQKMIDDFVSATDELLALYDFVGNQEKIGCKQNHDIKCKEKCGKVVAQFDILMGNYFREGKINDKIERFKLETYESSNYLFVITWLKQSEDTKKIILNYFSEVKMIQSKAIIVCNGKQHEEKMLVLMYQMKDVILTYGLSKDWTKCISDKYGVMAHIIDTTDQYQDLLALYSDVLIINPMGADSEVLPTIREYFSQGDEEDLPDLYFTKELEYEICHAKCWVREPHESKLFHYNSRMQADLKNFVILENDNKKEIMYWEAKGFSKAKDQLFWHVCPEFQTMYEKELEKLISSEWIINSTILRADNGLGTYGMGGLGIFGILIQKDTIRQWIVFWDDNEFKNMLDEKTFVTLEENKEERPSYLPKLERRQINMEQLENQKIINFLEERDYYVFKMQDNQKKNHCLKISKGVNADIYWMEENTDIHD